MIEHPAKMREFSKKSSRDAYGRTLVNLGRENRNIVALTADLMHSVKTEEFKRQFPDRFFNFGVAEQNMMGAAAGMATCGKIPFVSTFACFASMRACEQVRTDIAYPRLNVKIVTTHAGVSIGAGGTTHHATEDIGIMRSIANMRIIVPADAIETEKAVRAASEYEGPVYMRLGRNPEPVIYSQDYNYEIGKAVYLREGRDVTIIATGRMVAESLIAACELETEGIEVRVINMHTVKPLDKEAVMEAANNTQLIVTVEEHNVIGGLGSAVAEAVTEQNSCPVRRIGIPDIFSVIGSYNELLERYGLTGEQIANQIRKWVR